MSVILPEHVRRFLTEVPRVAAIATIDPDGKPRQTVTWFRLDDDGTLVLNSRPPRRWPANLERDGRVALAVTDAADGLRWVGLTGVISEVIHDQATAQADIAEMAVRYEGEEAARESIAEFRTFHRITFRARITGFHDHLED